MSVSASMAAGLNIPLAVPGSAGVAFADGGSGGSGLLTGLAASLTGLAASLTGLAASLTGLAASLTGLVALLTDLVTLLTDLAALLTGLASLLVLVTASARVRLEGTSSRFGLPARAGGARLFCAFLETGATACCLRTSPNLARRATRRPCRQPSAAPSAYYRRRRRSTRPWVRCVAGMA